MTVEIFRIRNNAAFLIEDFRNFMLKVFESNKLVKDPDAALAELASQIHLDILGLFVIRNEKEWTGAILCQHGRSAFNPACIVIHLYCKDAEPETGRELVQALYTFAQEGGYSDIIAIDTNNKAEAFSQLFSALGKPSTLGSVFHFDLDEGLL